MNDDQENLFDDNEGDESGTGSGDAGPAPQTGQTNGASNSDQRVSDLMSKWQTEQARANRLQAQLDQRGKGAGDGKTEGDAAAEPSQADQFLAYQRELTREMVFKRDERLAKYGLAASAITGATPAEMEASLEAHRAFLDSVETQARQGLMVEFGIEPTVGGGGASEPPANFGTMSSEEFEKYVARVKNGY